jgi:hypothetical protein
MQKNPPAQQQFQPHDKNVVRQDSRIFTTDKNEGREEKNITANILCFAWHQHINNPKGLMMEELKDGLQYARICQADLRKHAKGLQKTHLRDCLVDLLEKSRKSTQRLSNRRSIEKKAKECGT